MTIKEKFKIFPQKVISSKQMRNDLKDIDINDEDLMDIIGDRQINALSDNPDTEMLDEISPALRPSFNLAAFANESQTLQMFIKLGVDLSHIENKSPETAEYLLKMNFDSDVKPYIHFLVDNGVKPEELGQFLTQNPFIFGQHLDDLQIRIKYLESKKFSKEMIATVITRAPKFLNYSTKGIDYRLGLLQKDFHLSPDEVRQLMTTLPRIGLLHQMSYQRILIAFKDEFGFESNEIKQMLLIFPTLFRRIAVVEKGHRIVVQVFDYVHNHMKIPHQLIAKHPQILDGRKFQIEGRHRYLTILGRHQYDPKQPLYVPLSAFTLLDDNEFCEKYTKTSVEDFNLFLKSI